MQTISRGKTKEGLAVDVEMEPGRGPDWRDEQEFAAHYRDQGYVIARGLVPVALADEAVIAFEAEVKPFRGPILRQLTTRMEEHRFSPDGYMMNPILSVQDLSEEQFPAFRRSSLAVLTCPQVQRVLRGLAGEAVTCVESMYFESSARGTITHADGHFMDASVPGAMIASWYALEDIHAGAGRRASCSVPTRRPTPISAPFGRNTRRCPSAPLAPSTTTAKKPMRRCASSTRGCSREACRRFHSMRRP